MGDLKKSARVDGHIGRPLFAARKDLLLKPSSSQAVMVIIIHDVYEFIMMLMMTNAKIRALSSQQDQENIHTFWNSSHSKHKNVLHTQISNDRKGADHTHRQRTIFSGPSSSLSSPNHQLSSPNHQTLQLKKPPAEALLPS